MTTSQDNRQDRAGCGGPLARAGQRLGMRQREAVARELAKFLLAHERVVFISRPHPIQFLGPLSVAAVSLSASALLGMMSSGRAALVLVAIASGVGGFTALANAIWSAIAWRGERLFVTNHRIGRKYGVINKFTSSIPNRHVTYASLEPSPLGWLLGYGRIRLENGGHRPGVTVLPMVKNPEATLRAIMSVAPPGTSDEDARD